MILRAIFWIALVSVLMPHEPDLGFGRPQGTALLPSQVGEWAKATAAAPGAACDGRQTACTAGLAFLDSLQIVAVRSLAQVKADIDQNRRQRFLTEQGP